MTELALHAQNEREGYSIEGEDARSNPCLTPTLVIGLGGTGTDAVRLLKRRLVWLWHRPAIEAQMDKVPNGWDPHVWYGEVWRRFEMEGGPPIIQLLAVDTWPWTNRAGQVYLNHHEYAYLGGYNARKVLDNLENHPEIADWWQWGRDQIRPGQIHSGARQIRPLGRLSFYRRYREFWAKLKPQIDRISSIQAKQETEKGSYQVAPSGATRRVYIITSVCGGTGAGAFLDVAARLRAHFEEEAIITGIFALPSVFLPELGSDLQKNRVRANAYAALKEIDYFQSHNFRLWLPGEDQVEVDALFNRLYLVGRENKEHQSLNSIDDIKQLIANQIFLEGLTHVGSKVWEYDVNVTMERREQDGRLVAFNFSSFANSSLIVPREQMLEYCELAYAQKLITERLLQELSPEDENLIGAEVQATAGRLRHVVPGSRGGSESLDEAGYEDEYEDEFEERMPEAEAITAAGAASSRVAPLEQLEQDINTLTARYGLRAALEFARRLAEEVGNRLGEAETSVTAQNAQIQAIQQQLYELRSSQRWYWSVWPLSLLMGAAARSRVEEIATLERRTLELQGVLQELMRQHTGWQQLVDSIAPISNQIGDRIEMIQDIRDSRFGRAMQHLFESRPVTDQAPYEMLTMVLGERYIRERLSARLDASQFLPHFGEDARQLLGSPLVCLVRREVSSSPEPGTDRYPTVLALATSDADKLETALRRVAAMTAHQVIPRDLFHIRRILDTPDSEFQTKLQSLFTRCQPFWRYSLDIGNLSEQDLEQVTLAGIGENTHRSWKYILRDFADFEQVETNDPTRIDACRIEHGLPIKYLDVLQDLRSKYHKFCEIHAGPMQLDARWEPDGDDPLPDLIPDAPVSAPARGGAGLPDSGQPAPPQPPGSAPDVGSHPLPGGAGIDPGVTREDRFKW